MYLNSNNSNKNVDEKLIYNTNITDKSNWKYNKKEIMQTLGYFQQIAHSEDYIGKSRSVIVM